MWGKSFINSTIGRKVLMSLTGLFLCLYLIVHLAGNLLLLADGDGTVFLTYAEQISSLWIIRVIEIFLLAAFLIHIIDSAMLTYNNRKARPATYDKRHAAANSSWSSRNMGFLGVILLIFLVIHIAHFFLPTRFGSENLYDIVLWRFSIWWYSLFYILSMVALAFHLVHGVKSSFRTLGLHHSKYIPIVKTISYAFAIIFPLGFAFIPFYFYMKSIGVF